MKKLMVALVVLGLMASAFSFLAYSHGPPDQAPVSCKQSTGKSVLIIDRPGDLLNLFINLVNGCPEALNGHFHRK